MAECTYCLVRGSLVIDQGELERGSTTCLGCIVDDNLSVLNLVIVKNIVPHWLGPKRASKMKQSALDSIDFVTPCVLQHKHQCNALKKQCAKKNKEEAAEYANLVVKKMKEAKEKCKEKITKS
ncbi:hypothetical protein A6R68_09825, partial [Neotoma lepida]